MMTSRWHIWLMVLLGMAACGKRQLNPVRFQSGYGTCNQNNLGDFKITLAASQANPGAYELTVISYLVPKAGQIVRIALANQDSENGYRDLAKNVPLAQNTQLLKVTLTPDDLSYYQLVGIVPVSGGQSNFLDETDPNLAICELPSVSGARSPVY